MLLSGFAAQYALHAATVAVAAISAAIVGGLWIHLGTAEGADRAQVADLYRAPFTHDSM